MKSKWRELGEALRLAGEWYAELVVRCLEKLTVWGAAAAGVAIGVTVGLWITTQIAKLAH